MRIFPNQVKYVRVIVQRRSSEEVYDGHVLVIFVLLYVQLFLYVVLYKNLGVDDLYGAGFS